MSVDRPLIREARGTYRNSQIITSGKLRDLTNVSEASAHHNGLVSELLVVIEYLLNAFNSRVILGAVLLLVRCFVPVQNTANERRDQESASLSCGNGLGEGEHESQVAVHTVLRLQDMGCLNTLPCRSELDEDTRLIDANVLVELESVSGR